jgi:hypothetical protein
VIAALGASCMFERVPEADFDWIAPAGAGFLEISDWGIDDEVSNTIAKRLEPRYKVRSIVIEHQDFEAWTYASLAKRIRELPIPEVPVDAYLLVLRDWRRDSIGNTDNLVGGLGLYRRGGGRRLGAFASYRLVLLDAGNGNLIASRPAVLADGRLPWVPMPAALWPRTPNDLTNAQRRALRTDFIDLINATLPRALEQIGFAK